MILGFPGGSVVKNLLVNSGDMGSIPRSGRSPGEENGKLLQYSCLENSIDRGAGGLQSIGSQRVEYNWAGMHACARMHTHTHKKNMVPRMMAKRRHSIPRGGHGNQPQYSYLENMMDRGVWWATIRRVTKSWTWLKSLSTDLHACQHSIRT